MLTRLDLFAWLVELEAPDAPPARRDALRNAYSLAGLAATDGLVASDEQGFGAFTRTLAELEADGWVAWDWRQMVGDSHAPPIARFFGPGDAQTADNVRITPEAYTAFAARRRVQEPAAPPPASPTSPEQADEEYRDVFLSHASEDKDAIARPLYERLTALGYTVWYDQAELTLGDSLSQRIDHGLATSRFGVVIVSAAFLSKPWPQRELSGLVAREMAGGEKMVLPVWHGVDHARVAQASPPLADLLAATSDDGIDDVADRIARAIERRRGTERAVGGHVPARAERLNGAELPDPVDLRDDLVGLLRADDQIGIRELLQAERRRFDGGVIEALARAGNDMGTTIDGAKMTALEGELWRLVERRLATLVPLVEHDADRAVRELRPLAALAGRTVPTGSHRPEWVEATRWPAWLVVHVVGAVATMERAWLVARALWDTPTADGRPLAAISLAGAERLGDELATARPNMRISSQAKALWHLTFRLAGSPLVTEALPRPHPPHRHRRAGRQHTLEARGLHLGRRSPRRQARRCRGDPVLARRADGPPTPGRARSRPGRARAVRRRGPPYEPVPRDARRDPLGRPR